MEPVSLVGAFVAGVLSFVTPSVVPLIPGYAFFMAGVSLAETSGTAKRRVILTSLLFILGFSLVFVTLGVGEFMQHFTMLAKIAGLLLIVVGLRAMRVFKIPFNLPIAAVVGGAFAFGWAPFIGPTLAAILAVASQPDSAGEGISLLSIYSLGLAVSFLLTALVINQLFVTFSGIRRHAHTIEIASGMMLIVTGALIVSNRFTIIAQWLSPYLPAF